MSFLLFIVKTKFASFFWVAFHTDKQVFDKIRKSRESHLNWKGEPAIPEFLSKFNHYVYVIATPNKKAKDWKIPKAKFAVREEFPKLTGTEVLLTQTDIHKVCPMVAYSGCAALILAQAHPISRQ